MDKIKLVKPSEKLKNKAQEFKLEYFDNGENVLHGGALLEQLAYDEWLELIEDNSSEATVKSNWVVSSTFFAVRESDSKIIGIIDIRHYLNDFLENYGGHIGYSVRPTERRKGYATEMLKLGLKYCKSIGLNTVMLACYKDNTASSKTIVKCGGILEKEFVYSDGKIIQVFWIAV